MRRWRERYEKYGYDGLLDRRRGKPSPRRVAVETVEEVLRLYQEKYADLSPRRPALSREVSGGTRYPAGLHVSEASLAGGGISAARDGARCSLRASVARRGGLKKPFQLPLFP
jgi:hypothetical protein